MVGVAIGVFMYYLKEGILYTSTGDLFYFYKGGRLYSLYEEPLDYKLLNDIFTIWWGGLIIGLLFLLYAHYKNIERKKYIKNSITDLVFYCLKKYINVSPIITLYVENKISGNWEKVKWEKAIRRIIYNTDTFLREIVLTDRTIGKYPEYYIKPLDFVINEMKVIIPLSLDLIKDHHKAVYKIYAEMVLLKSDLEKYIKMPDHIRYYENNSMVIIHKNRLKTIFEVAQNLIAREKTRTLSLSFLRIEKYLEIVHKNGFSHYF